MKRAQLLLNYPNVIIYPFENAWNHINLPNIYEPTSKRLYNGPNSSKYDWQKRIYLYKLIVEVHFKTINCILKGLMQNYYNSLRKFCVKPSVDALNASSSIILCNFTQMHCQIAFLLSPKRNPSFFVFHRLAKLYEHCVFACILR